MSVGRGLLAALLLAANAQGAAANDPEITARRAVQMLDRAAAELAAADGARDRVTALTGIVQAYEEGLLALREGLRQATIRERAVVQRLRAEEQRVARLLAALQVMGQAPAPLFLLHPTGPLGTARAGMMLSDLTPRLQAEAEALKSELDELRVLRLLQESASGTLENGLDGVQAARVALSRAIADRVTLPGRFDTDPDAMRALVESSDTLAGFAEGLARLEVQGQAPPPQDFESRKGKLPLPVAGAAILRRYDEADAAGIRRPGLVLAVPGRALVSAPWPATVRYAGPLLDYGNVIVMEPGTGYLVVIAGLADLYAAPGDVIAAGAALGLAGGPVPDAEEIVARVKEGSGVPRRETLYIELRAGSRTLDPEQWFARAKE